MTRSLSYCNKFSDHLALMKKTIEYNDLKRDWIKVIIRFSIESAELSLALIVSIISWLTLFCRLLPR